MDRGIALINQATEFDHKGLYRQPVFMFVEEYEKAVQYYKEGCRIMKDFMRCGT